MDWKSFGRPLHTPGTEGISEGNVSELTTVENAVSCGADAIMTYLYVGHKDNKLEKEEINATPDWQLSAANMELS